MGKQAKQTMLRVDRVTGTMTALNSTTLTNAGLGERSGLQELILKNSESFFAECQETLFFIREEIEPSKEVASRIDLLAIDIEGRAVIVELKRGSDKLQLLQSLTYAAMISDWTKEQFEKQIPISRLDAYKEFMDDHEITQVNQFQRVILIAES